MLLDIAEAFMTCGQTPYSASKPSKDDVKIYLSSSATQRIEKALAHLSTKNTITKKLRKRGHESEHKEGNSASLKVIGLHSIANTNARLEENRKTYAGGRKQKRHMDTFKSWASFKFSSRSPFLRSNSFKADVIASFCFSSIAYHQNNVISDSETKRDKLTNFSLVAQYVYKKIYFSQKDVPFSSQTTSSLTHIFHSAVVAPDTIETKQVRILIMHQPQ